MEHFGKNKSPYHGVWQTCIGLIGVPIGFFFLVRYAIFRFQDFPDDMNNYAAMMFGFGIGSLFNISLMIAGLLKEPFNAVVTRTKNLIGNLFTMPFKVTRKCYAEDVREYGLVFWIFMPIMVACFILTFIGFKGFFEAYAAYIN